MFKYQVHHPSLIAIHCWFTIKETSAKRAVGQFLSKFVDSCNERLKSIFLSENVADFSSD